MKLLLIALFTMISISCFSQDSCYSVSQHVPNHVHSMFLDVGASWIRNNNVDHIGLNWAISTQRGYELGGGASRTHVFVMTGWELRSYNAPKYDTTANFFSWYLGAPVILHIVDIKNKFGIFASSGISGGIMYQTNFKLISHLFISGGGAFRLNHTTIELGPYIDYTNSINYIDNIICAGIRLNLLKY